MTRAWDHLWSYGPLPGDKHTHAKLVSIIGDPHAEESKWMAACVAVGDKTLVKTEQSRPGGLLVVGRALARRSIAFNVLFSWALIVLLAEQYTMLMGGPGTVWAGDHLGAGPGLGMILSFFGALGFWREFPGGPKNKWLPVVWSGLAVFGLAYGIVSGHILQVAIPLAAGFASFILLAKLAGYVRKTLPPTFRADKTLLLCGAASAPCAILMVCTLIAMASHPATAPSGMTAVSWSYMATTLFFAAMTITVPAYACTRVSRSTSMASSLALNSLLSAPMLSGLFVGALVTTMTNIDPANFFNSGIFALSMWGAWLSSLALVGSGSYLGTKRNAGIHRRKLKRAGGSLLLDTES